MLKIKSLNHLGTSKWKKVLVFMPHPDDEAVFCAGLIQHAVEAGLSVRVVTLTQGEASTLRYTLTDKEDLATVRRKELKNALRVLGITSFKIYNAGDGKLNRSQANVKKIVEGEIKSFNPSHIVTLEPDGIYGHPDHITLSKIVTRFSVKKTLVYATVTPKYIFPTARKMATKSEIKPITPDYRLSLAFKQIVQKIKALKSHKSQFQALFFHPATILHFLLNDLLFHEHFAIKNK